MRLGIDDAAQLSRLLGLSINTIYTYRNKTKLRALDRENFEQNVLKIGDID
jgi:DNA-binding CsgD family transcriptional regulator